MTTGRFTLPVAIAVSVTCWLLNSLLLPQTNSSIVCFLLYAVIGYILIQLNNVYALIRMRASVQTSIFALLIAVCPTLHALQPAVGGTLAFLGTLFFLFGSYQKNHPAASLFHAFALLSIGSYLFPQLFYFVPLLWLGAYLFRSLTLRSICGSLVGLAFPYWLLWGHAFFHEEMELFYRPFLELQSYHPFSFHYDTWLLGMMSYLTPLFIVSTIHCMVASFDDKRRTRSYLNFLILLGITIFIMMVVQSEWAASLLPLFIITVSILAGHLFVVSSNRNTNIFFICAFVGLFFLFGFNLWILL